MNVCTGGISEAVYNREYKFPKSSCMSTTSNFSAVDRLPSGFTLCIICFYYKYAISFLLPFLNIPVKVAAVSERNLWCCGAPNSPFISSNFSLLNVRARPLRCGSPRQVDVRKFCVGLHGDQYTVFGRLGELKHGTQHQCIRYTIHWWLSYGSRTLKQNVFHLPLFSKNLKCAKLSKVIMFCDWFKI